MDSESESILAETRAWVNRAVIGLNLCPFARAVEVNHQIRYALTKATDAEALLEVLESELRLLVGTDPAQVETTLLVHPYAFAEFEAFNEFLGEAEATVERLGLSGILQVASFHPQFQFADTEPEDITNATNRSPYPTLHLLREESITRAVDSLSDPASIYEANIVTLRSLGHAGWADLRAQCKQDASRPGGDP